MHSPSGRPSMVPPEKLTLPLLTDLHVVRRGIFDVAKDSELHMLAMRSQGFEGQDIADALGFARGSVAVYIHNLTRRLQLKNRLHLMGAACRSEIFTKPLPLTDAQPDRLSSEMVTQLELTSYGLTPTELATEFSSSEGYIRNRSGVIRERLDAHTTDHAIRIAYDLELLDRQAPVV